MLRYVHFNIFISNNYFQALRGITAFSSALPVPKVDDAYVRNDLPYLGVLEQDIESLPPPGCCSASYPDL